MEFFLFGETAKSSYERMIDLVNIAENTLKRKINLNFNANQKSNNSSNFILPYLRGIIGKKAKELSLTINGFLKLEIIQVLTSFLKTII